MVAVGVVLHNFHGFHLLQACLFSYLILARISVVLKVPHVGDVAHVTNLIAQVLQVAVHQIEGDGRAGVAQMRIPIYRGTAHIQAHMRRAHGFKNFLSARQRIVEAYFVFHGISFFGQK